MLCIEASTLQCWQQITATLADNYSLRNLTISILTAKYLFQVVHDYYIKLESAAKQMANPTKKNALCTDPNYYHSSPKFLYSIAMFG